MAVPVWTTVTGTLNTSALYWICGTQSAGLAGFAFTSSDPGSTDSEEYNGTTWSTGGSANTARYSLACCGTQTAALYFGGRTDASTASAVTEEYDGSTWTTAGSMDLNTAVYLNSGFGTQTAGVSVKFYSCEEYDGSTWSSGGSLSVSHSGAPAAGVLTAGLVAGGNASTDTEEYDGTDWATGGSSLITMYGGAGCGTLLSALAVDDGIAQQYDGTSWTYKANANVASNGGIAGSTSTAMKAGGYLSPSYVNITEEYHSPIELTNGISFSHKYYLSGGAETSFDIVLTNSTEADDLLFIVVNKDDDIPSGGAPSGWELVFGGNSGTGMYTEIFYKLATGSETTVSFTGLDSEEYAVGTFIVGGAQADKFAIDANTGSGTSVTQTVNIPEAEVGVSFFGFGADDGEVPHTFDTDFTTPFIDSIVTTSGGSGSISLSAAFAQMGGVWSSANQLSTNRNGLALFGTQTSSVAAVGDVLSVNQNTSEEYDGTNWSSGGNVTTARRNTAAAGTLTSGLLFGGETSATNPRADTDEYDGTTWTTTGSMDLLNSRCELGGCGTQTAALAVGGDETANFGYCADVEEYNGSTWSSSASLNGRVYINRAVGTTTSALSIGGSHELAVDNEIVESYNGTAWSLAPSLIYGKYAFPCFGTENSAVAAGGSNAPTDNTQEWNGSAWFVTSPTSYLNLGGSGSSIAGLAAGGYSNTSSSEYDTYSSFTSPAWSSGGNLNTARRYLAGCGIRAAGLSFGGWTGATSAVTEEYDGSTWSSGGDLSTARRYLAGCGTQTAGLSFGGDTDTYLAVTEEYDGSTWSSGGNLNTARHSLAGCGTQSAGLSFGGWATTNSTVTEEYDGSSWSSGGALNTARYYLAGCGTQSAGLSFGGWATTYSAVTEEYDGSTWSSGGNLSTARYSLAGCGTQTAGLSFGGDTGANSAVTEEYDGSTWSSGGNLSTARYSLAGCGTQTAGLSFGGYTNTYLAVTEEYTGYDHYAASLTHTLDASDEWLAWSITVFAQVDEATGDVIFVYKMNPEFQQQMVTAATLGGILVE